MPRTEQSSNWKNSPSRMHIVWFCILQGGLGFLIAAIACEPGQHFSDAYKHLSFFWRLFVPCFIAGLIVTPFAREQFRRRDKLVQVQRDVQARSILEKLQEGQSVKFAVYLRSFWMTGNAPTSLSEADAQSELIKYIKYDKRDFEFVLAEAIHAELPLVGLGRCGEAIGIGRIETDNDTWKENVIVLCRAAQRVYVSPLYTEGTHWELQFLKREGLLEKVVFLMPQTRFRFTESALSAKWNAARAAYGAIGIQIPKYSTDGALFRLDCQGNVLNKVPLGVKNPVQLREKISQIAADPPSVTPNQVPDLKSSSSRSEGIDILKLSFLSLLVALIFGFLAVALLWHPIRDLRMEQFLIGGICAVVAVIASIVFPCLVVVGIWLSLLPSDKGCRTAVPTVP